MQGSRLAPRSVCRVLFDTDRLLQKQKATMMFLRDLYRRGLLDRSIVAYTKGENGMLSGRLYAEKGYAEKSKRCRAADRRMGAFPKRSPAGATTAQFGKSECLYLAIRAGGRVHGVIGIPMKPEKPDSFGATSYCQFAVNECALAMDNAHNAAEKGTGGRSCKASSPFGAPTFCGRSPHDLRTPLCSVSGNADTLFA